MKTVQHVYSFLFLLCLTLIVSGCRTTHVASLTHPEKQKSPSEFQSRINRILQDSIFSQAQVGIKIVSVTNNDVLYEHDSKKLFHPASNTKLLTTVAALKTLGPHFSFHTRFYADTSINKNGTLEGSLYLKGSGNPDFTIEQLDTLINSLARQGLKHVKGSLVGDVSYFDSKDWGTGWMWDDDPFDFAMHITPLSINNNCVKIFVKPGEEEKKPLRVAVSPWTSYVTIQNEGITGPDSSAQTLDVTRSIRPEENIIKIQGSLPLQSAIQHYDLNIWKPELFTLDIARQLFEQKGIIIDSMSKLGVINPGCHILADHSWGIDTVLINMNQMSDNLSAENILKTAAAEHDTCPGSTFNGLKIEKNILASMSIDTSQYMIVDGSGISSYNLISPDALVTILYGMAKEKELFPLFKKSLPIGGLSGTLQSRMKKSAAERKIFAKTGTITGASALSGYAETVNGELLAFSIMMENYVSTAHPFRSLQDSIAAAMTKFRR